MSYQFPNLPPVQNQVQWPAHIVSAYQNLQTIFERAQNLARQDQPDPVRVQLVVTDIVNRCGPLLRALESELPNEGWVPACAEVLFRLALFLQIAIDAADGREDDNIQFVQLVTDVRTPGQRGRPPKQFDNAILQLALDGQMKISIPALARVMKVHPNTLRKYVKKHGLYNRFSPITDGELDAIMRSFHMAYPASGIRYATGFLRRRGVRIPKRRIIASLRRVSPVGRTMRTRVAIVRREYSQIRPNAMWHLDGHHKLIRWGIVIHGTVDGYSRKIVGLRASSDNTAETVLALFIESVKKHGFPSRVRGDRGSENIEVSVFITLFRGLNRGSFVWGTSTRNTRIERLWVEVGSQFARPWQAFFRRLERLHRLDCSKPAHLWLLRHLFLPKINDDCVSFQENWNNHPIARLGHDQSPEEMYLLGQLMHGRYPTPTNVHSTIKEKYGMVPDPRQALSAHLARNVHHNAVPVPSNGNPFPSDEATTTFMAALNSVIDSRVIPDGFYLLEDEWDGVRYPTSEPIRVARKDVDIPLPFEVWYPRAVMWAQGLRLMIIVQESASSGLSMSCQEPTPTGVCTCIAFVKRKSKDKCKTCKHPKSAHTSGAPATGRSTRSSSTASNSGPKSTVDDVLERYFSGNLRSASNSTGVSGKKAKTEEQAAREETNSGFRPRTRRSAGQQPSASGSQAVRPAKKSQERSGIVKIGGIVIITCGLTDDGKLKSTKAPTKQELLTLRTNQLAVLERVKGIDMDLAMNQSEIEGWLTAHLPTFFRVLDRLDPPIVGQSRWVLAAKDRLKLYVVRPAKGELTGSDLWEARGPASRPFREATIHNATKREIPHKICEDLEAALTGPLPSEDDEDRQSNASDDGVGEDASDCEAPATPKPRRRLRSSKGKGKERLIETSPENDDTIIDLASSDSEVPREFVYSPTPTLQSLQKSPPKPRVSPRPPRRQAQAGPSRKRARSDAGDENEETRVPKRVREEKGDPPREESTQESRRALATTTNTKVPTTFAMPQISTFNPWSS
ncbi:hypothetical protein NMY22_g7983 [Coprinellus aureogranulatus]|nr:hypothetical protein NMY22_g7983 [Coprinellus aureogranulatus]